MENLIIRYAKREELESVNKIRKQVTEVNSHISSSILSKPRFFASSLAKSIMAVAMPFRL